jgi:hypothetical protein
MTYSTDLYYCIECSYVYKVYNIFTVKFYIFCILCMFRTYSTSSCLVTNLRIRSMYVCIYVCMYVCMYVCKSIYTTGWIVSNLSVSQTNAVILMCMPHLCFLYAFLPLNSMLAPSSIALLGFSEWNPVFGNFLLSFSTIYA